MDLSRDGHRGHRPEGRRQGHSKDEEDRQRDQGPRDPRHGDRAGRAGRDHRRLVRAGQEGHIWYLGEYVTNYESGKVVDHAGSFEAGVDGAQPGIAMPANPKPGLSYRQEYYKGEAEDKAAVITVGEEQVEVPFGYFRRNILMTRDLVPTEPRVQELKFYAPGVGPLLSMHTDGPGGRAALVSYRPGR